MPYGNLLADVVQSSTVGTPPQFNDGGGTQVGTLCRAWANWTSAGTLNAGFNVSSITKVSTGAFTVNFTNALVDTNYAVTSAGSTSATINGWAQAGETTSGTKLTTSIRVNYLYASGLYDPYTCNVAIFR